MGCIETKAQDQRNQQQIEQCSGYNQWDERWKRDWQGSTVVLVRGAGSRSCTRSGSNVVSVFDAAQQHKLHSNCSASERALGVDFGRNSGHRGVGTDFSEGRGGKRGVEGNNESPGGSGDAEFDINRDVDGEGIYGGFEFGGEGGGGLDFGGVESKDGCGGNVSAEGERFDFGGGGNTDFG